MINRCLRKVLLICFVIQLGLTGNSTSAKSETCSDYLRSRFIPVVNSPEYTKLFREATALDAATILSYRDRFTTKEINDAASNFNRFYDEIYAKNSRLQKSRDELRKFLADLNVKGVSNGSCGHIFDGSYVSRDLPKVREVRREPERGQSSSSEFHLNPTCNKLNDLWRQRFYSDFKISWKFEPFPCPSVTSKIAEAIYFVYSLSAKRFRSGTKLPDFYQLLAESVGRTSYQEYKTGPSSSNIPAETFPKSGDIVIYKFFTEATIVARASNLIHESRHLNPNNPNAHVICDHGDKQGRAGCDDQLVRNRFFSGGAYSAQFYFLEQVYLNVDELNLDKAAVRHLLCWTLAHSFNYGYQRTLEEYSCGNM